LRFKLIIQAHRKHVTNASQEDLVNKNKAWSNVYNFNPNNLDSTDVLIYPKKTRWYSNLIALRTGKANEMNKNNDKDINSQS
jgi:hypothetical protein